MGPAGRPDGNLYVLPKRDQKIHQPFDRKVAGTIAHQHRDMGLLDAEQSARLRLREMAVFDDAVDLQRKMSLELLAFRISKAYIGEYIAAALFESRSVFFFTAMVNCSFAGQAAYLCIASQNKGSASFNRGGFGVFTFEAHPKSSAAIRGAALQSSYRLLASHTRKIFEKLVKCVFGLQIINQCLGGNASPDEDRSSTKDFWVAMNYALPAPTKFTRPKDTIGPRTMKRKVQSALFSDRSEAIR